MLMTPRLLLLSVLFVFAGAATAQDYPVKPIRIIVPYATGGSTDVLARILAPRLTEILGKSVHVENKPGGASMLGVDTVAKSPPDGYTLGIVNIAFVANPSLKTNLPYDTEKDLVPISLLSTATLVMAVHPSVQARSVKEFIALAKAKPGSLFFGSAGIGAGNHLMTERFNYMAGIKMVHVPYKGGGPSVVGLISGETSVLFASIPSTIQFFQSGKLVPLGVGSLKRNDALPNVPTLAEAVPGFEASEWIGLVTTAGTPPAVVNRLNQALVQALSMPQVKESILGLGADPIGSSQQEFSAFIKKEIGAWSKVIKDVGITID